MNGPTDHVQSEAPPLENLIDRAARSWRASDWEALAAIDSGAMEGAEKRADIALFAAAGLASCGDREGAARMLRRALEWGCTPRKAAQVLSATAHNTLGRIAALANNDEKARTHFAAALADAPDSDADEKTVTELVSLGLLLQARDALAAEIETLRNAAMTAPDLRARFDILQSQINLLRHELSIAQQRKQLFGGDGRGDRSTLKDRSLSQLGQDLWALEMSGFKRGGYFVEFGATDGVSLSNTYLLEKEYGWTGLLAEPNPAFLEKLRANRRSTVSDACIAAATGREVEFVFADEFGGIADFSDDGAHKDRREAYRKTGAVARLKTISLNDFLKQNDAPKEIDYISVDTEGSEFEILNAFPFSAWNVRCWTIEHNFTPNRARIHKLMTSHGYQRKEAQWDDWYFRE